MTSTNSGTRPSYVVLDIGCSECRGWSDDEPLIESLAFFDTLDEAKRAHPDVHETAWKPHPLGGVFEGRSTGDVWIAPVEVFRKGSHDA